MLLCDIGTHVPDYTVPEFRKQQRESSLWVRLFVFVQLSHNNTSGDRHCNVTVLGNSLVLWYDTASLSNQSLAFQRYCSHLKYQEMFPQWCNVMSQGNEILNVILDEMESTCNMDIKAEKCIHSYRQNMCRTEKKASGWILLKWM
jgi:hypothetical protein